MINDSIQSIASNVRESAAGSLDAILRCSEGICAHDEYSQCMGAIKREAALLLSEVRLLRSVVEAVVRIAGDQSLDTDVYDLEPLADIREHLRRTGYVVGAAGQP